MNHSVRPVFRPSQPHSISHLLFAPDLHQALAELAAEHLPQAAYWLLECKLEQGSQWLVFTHLTALCAACEQIASNKGEESLEVFLHGMAGRKAAGLLFTRHPERLDLPYRVLEIIPFQQASEKPQRWVFDKNATIHYHQGNIDTPPLPLAAFAAMAQHADSLEQGPQQLHWWHDGNELFLLAAEPIAALKTTQEAWRQAPELWAGAVSPLWYSCSARWLKTHFWRPLGKKYQLQHLDNVEPYRRQAGHLYFNAQFALALVNHAPHLSKYLPPDWQPQQSTHVQLKPSSLTRLRWRLLRLQKQFEKAQIGTTDAHWQALWQQWMQLDQLGEKLAGVLGELYYLYGEGYAHVQASAPIMARFGADPLLPLVEQDAKAQQALPQRQFISASEPVLPTVSLFQRASSALLYQGAMELWHAIGTSLRQLAETLGLLLTEAGHLLHPDAIHFLYFDELWELVHQQGHITAERLTQRQHQYMQAALAAAPEWQLAGMGYEGGSLQKGQDIRITGVVVAQGEAQGRAQLIHSSWCLNEIQPGDVLILKHYHPSWLPWFAEASAIIIAAPVNDTEAILYLAKQAQIPVLADVTDGLHYFNNQDKVQVMAGESGWIAHQG